MANPYTKQLRVAYQPLNLNPIATAAGINQKGFDTVKGQADNATFNLANLPQDDPRRKGLVEEYEGKVENTVEELMKSGDWRKANTALTSLNREWTKNEERKLIESKYTDFKDKDKIMRELYLDPKNMDTYNPERYNEWKTKSMFDYKGLNYDKETGEYNPFTFGTRFQDVTGEMMKEATSLAEKAPADIYEQLGKFKGAGVAFNYERIKKHIENKDKGKLSQEIFQVLSQTDKYKRAIAQDAEYDIFSKQRQDPEYLQKYATEKVGEIDKVINTYKNAPAIGEDGKALEGAELAKFNKKRDEILEELNKRRDSFIGSVQEGGEDYLKRIYKGEYVQNAFQKTSSSAADAFDYTNETYDIDYLKDTYSEGMALHKAKKKYDNAADNVGVLGGSPVNTSSGFKEWKTDNKIWKNPYNNEIKFKGQLTVRDFIASQKYDLNERSKAIDQRLNASNLTQTEKDRLLDEQSLIDTRLNEFEQREDNLAMESANELGENNLIKIKVKQINDGTIALIGDDGRKILKIEDELDKVKSKKLSKEAEYLNLDDSDIPKSRQVSVWTVNGKEYTNKENAKQAIIEHRIQSEYKGYSKSTDGNTYYASNNNSLENMEENMNMKSKDYYGTTDQSNMISYNPEFFKDKRISSALTQALTNPHDQGKIIQYYDDESGAWKNAKEMEKYGAFDLNDVENLGFDEELVNGKVVYYFNGVNKRLSETKTEAETKREKDDPFTYTQASKTSDVSKHKKFLTYRVVLNNSQSQKVKEAQYETVSTPEEAQVANMWTSHNTVNFNNEYSTKTLGEESPKNSLRIATPNGTSNIGQYTIEKTSSVDSELSESIFKLRFYDTQGSLIGDNYLEVNQAELNQITTDPNKATAAILNLVNQ